MTALPIRPGQLLAGVVLLCFSSAISASGAQDANESVHYVETAKPIEPLDPKKAIDLAMTFFKKKYPNNSKIYFAQKIEYDGYANSPHPYCWEIYITAKPGHGIVLSDPFSVTLLVTQEGKVSVEHEVYAGGTDK